MRQRYLMNSGRFDDCIFNGLLTEFSVAMDEAVGDPGNADDFPSHIRHNSDLMAFCILLE